MDATLTGLLLLNGEDVWLRWHAFLSDEGRQGSSLSSLLQPASAKPIPTVSYPEESGARYPQSIQVTLEPREITLGFAIAADTLSDYMAYYTEFLGALRRGLIELRVPELGRTYKLLYRSCSTYQQLAYVSEGYIVGRMDIKFIEPSPSY